MKLHYLSFLLRIWNVGPSDSHTWMASLENPHTREIQQFNNLDMLWQHLQNLVVSEDGPNEDLINADLEL
jgi:hypothetical protein